MDTKKFILHIKIEHIYKDIVNYAEKILILQIIGKKNRYQKQKIKTSLIYRQMNWVEK